MDSSSGNTAIAYAMIGASLGFPVENSGGRKISTLKGRKPLKRSVLKSFIQTRLRGSDGAILLARKNQRAIA